MSEERIAVGVSLPRRTCYHFPLFSSLSVSRVSSTVRTEPSHHDHTWQVKTMLHVAPAVRPSTRTEPKLRGRPFPTTHQQLSLGVPAAAACWEPKGKSEQAPGWGGGGRETDKGPRVEPWPALRYQESTIEGGPAPQVQKDRFPEGT